MVRQLVRASARPALADALALLLFVVVGAFTHDVSLWGFLRDLLVFEGAWFALWRMPLPVRWLGGVTLAVGVRAAFVGRFSLSFYLVALAFTALFVTVGRLVVARATRG